MTIKETNRYVRLYHIYHICHCKECGKEGREWSHSQGDWNSHLSFVDMAVIKTLSTSKKDGGK
mgnify:CR=1 FL=1